MWIGTAPTSNMTLLLLFLQNNRPILRCSYAIAVIIKQNYKFDG